MPDARDWIDALQLQPHPEGGWYKEVYRSEYLLPVSVLPSGFHGDRPVTTSIYYLLEAGDVSRFHRIQSDEIWHHYGGVPVRIHMLADKPSHGTIGSVPGETSPQMTVPAGVWFGAEPLAETGYALMGCTVAPGFDFAEFELAERNDLLSAYPSSDAVIRRLT